MSKLYSSKYIVKILEREGFEFVSQKGSHARYRKSGYPTLTVIVPMAKKEIPLGTFRSITRQARLTQDSFEQNKAA